MKYLLIAINIVALILAGLVLSNTIIGPLCPGCNALIIMLFAFGVTLVLGRFTKNETVYLVCLIISGSLTLGIVIVLALAYAFIKIIWSH
jgi:hypothetical protein